MQVFYIQFVFAVLNSPILIHRRDRFYHPSQQQQDLALDKPVKDEIFILNHLYINVIKYLNYIKFIHVYNYIYSDLNNKMSNIAWSL